MISKLSENIRNLRKDNKMTQEMLADSLGVTVGAVYKWEKGLSVPDLEFLMELADIFEVSMDYLLGYDPHNGSIRNMINRINEYMTAKDFDKASIEAEKALQKYPSNFRVIYTCAFMYMVKTSEDRSVQSMMRSNKLFEKALSLLDKDDPEGINEITIKNFMATNYISTGNIGKALDILKKNNISNINSSMISYLYAVELKDPEEAMHFAQKSVMNSTFSLVRSIFAISFAFAEKKDPSCMDTLLWLIDHLDSLKKDPDSLVYLDKIRILSLVLLSVWEEMFGSSKDSVAHLREAHDLTKRFEQNPVTTSQGIRFIDTVKGTLVDSFGDTVEDAIEEYVFGKVPGNKSSRKVRKLWDDMNS